MFIPDPDFYPCRIPDLGSQIQQQHQKRRGENFFVLPFFVAINDKCLLWDEIFSCSLDVPYGGLGMSKLQF
jgi:hypothetical protein